VGARIQQSADLDGEPTGGFTTIETYVIPDYADPANPPYMSLTTNNGTFIPGWYRIRFNDAGPGEEYTSPLFYDAISYRPSTRDVAVHIKNRTVDNLNNFVGDFTTTTVVTAQEVEELILKGEQRVLRRLDVDPNEPIPTESHEAIKNLIALYAAMLVELTKFSEQVTTNRSPYPQLKVLFDEQLAELREDVRGIVEDDPGGTGVGSGMAVFTFPEDAGGMINWQTRF
jgi:hypothetical protein